MASQDGKRPRRSLSKKNEKEKPSASAERNQNKWIFLVKDELISSTDEKGKDDSQSTVCKLRHPRTNQGSMFIVSHDGKTVCEVNSFKEQHRSWFIGNTVHGDGQIFMSTPVDPVFLALPYLINAGTSKRFMSLDQIVCDEELPDCHRLLSCSGLEQLDHVADVKDIDDDLRVYRYNGDKTLSWLKAKTEAAAEALKGQKVNVSVGGSHSAMFIRSNKSEATTLEDYIEFAFGIISDYLPVGLETELKNYLGIKEKEVVPKQEAAENEPPAKKPKIEDAVLEDYSLKYDLKKDKSKGKMTAAQKKLSKVDKSGMKSISSFFSAKS